MLTSCATSCASIDKVIINNPVYDPSFTIYDISERDINDNIIDFSTYRGKVLYIANTASYCGYTQSNFKLFEALNKYKEHGLEIIIKPCNQFGNQEPNSHKDIYAFATSYNYNGVILSKGDVNGANTSDLFKYLKYRTGKDNISWNFDGKFVVDKDGNVHSVTTDNVEKIIKQLFGLPREL